MWDKLRKLFSGTEEYRVAEDISGESSAQVTEVHRSVGGPRRGGAMSVPKHKQQRFEIVLIRAENTDEEVTVSIGAALKEGRCVIVDFGKGSDMKLCRRVVDFASGMAYICGGSTKKLGDNLFMFTPAEVTVIEENGNSPDDLVGG